MRVGLVINLKAARAQGHSDLERELLDLFASTRVHVKVFPLGTTDSLQKELEKTAPDALVGTGGDGTANAVAQIALDLKVPFGVIPIGTRNHFARDLNLPLTIKEAVQVIARGNTRCIDVGGVNGRIFLNNSSIGVYPRAVERREALRQRYPLPKMVAMALALVQVFAEARLLWATIRLDGRALQTVSPFIFVGNNHYELTNPTERFRSSLQEGKLSLFTADCGGVGGFLHLLWLSLRGRIEQSTLFHAHYGKKARISLKRRQVRISTDGEVWHANTPLDYSIREKALEVFT